MATTLLEIMMDDILPMTRLSHLLFKQVFLWTPEKITCTQSVIIHNPRLIGCINLKRLGCWSRSTLKASNYSAYLFAPTLLTTGHFSNKGYEFSSANKIRYTHTRLSTTISNIENRDLWRHYTVVQITQERVCSLFVRLDLELDEAMTDEGTKSAEWRRMGCDDDDDDLSGTLLNEPD